MILARQERIQRVPILVRRELLFAAIAWISSASLIAVLAKIVGYFGVLALAKSATVENFAEFGIFYSYITIVATFVPAGIYERVVAGVRTDQAEARDQLFSRGLGYFVSMFCVLLFMTLAGAIVFGASAERLLLICSAAIIGGLIAIVGLQAGFLRLEGRLGDSLRITSIFSIGSAFGLLIPSLFTGSIVHVLGGYAFASCLAIFLVRGYFSYEISLPPVEQWIGYFVSSIPYLIIAVLGWLSGYGINNISSIMLSASAVAIYTFLLTLSAVVQIVATAVNMYWGPKLIVDLKSNDNRERAHLRSYAFYSAVTGAISVLSIILLLVYEAGLKIAGGNALSYRGAEFEASLVLCSIILSVPWWNAQHYYHCHGAGSLLLKINVLTALPLVLAWIGLMMYLGSPGLFIGLVLLVLGKSVVLSVVAGRLWGCRSPLAMPILLSLFVVALGLFLSREV